MDLSAPHKVPLGWLMQHGSEAIRLRTMRDLAPPGQPGLDLLEQALVESKPVVAICRKQKDNGVWGGNLLGVAKSAKDGIKDVGTVAQYRHLTELGYPDRGRAHRLADRLLFRYLSRDPDPTLMFEYAKTVKAAPQSEEWVRDTMREAATAALAEAGHGDDPRIRGSAHKIATGVSSFLRSSLSENPLSRSGSSLILNPAANPPTWYTLALIAALPEIRRERGGFTERLGQYLSQPASRRTYTIAVGRKKLKPMHVLLGDPTGVDARGHVKDIPLTLCFIELMARIGAVGQCLGAQRALHRLYADCDNQGVWRPKSLTSAPKATSPVTVHYWPLQPDTKTVDGRLTDVTFRLALIAVLMGRPIEYV